MRSTRRNNGRYSRFRSFPGPKCMHPRVYKEAEGDIVKRTIVAALALTQAFAQTQIDLGRQAKNVDFGNLPFVRPFRTGTSLPPTCLTGEMFFLTTAAAGGNSYGCTAPNSWALEGQGSGGGATGPAGPAGPAGATGATGPAGATGSAGASASVPLQVSRLNGAGIQIGSNCSVSSPCNARLGGVVYTFVAPALATVQSGSGLAYIYLEGNGALTVGTSSATAPQVACSGCQTAYPVSQFPADSVPLATWNATSGTWDPTGADFRSILSGGRTFTAGQNIQITESGDNVVIAQITSNSQVSSGTSLAPYNPLDMTEFDRMIVFGEWSYATPAPFGYSSRCIGGGNVPGGPGEVTGPDWLGPGGPCVLYYPASIGGPHPFSDFLSGSSPLAYTLEARFVGGSGSPGPGNFYIGWSSADDGTVNNFVGIRYLASGNVWQCIITSGGNDVIANTMATTPDGAFHTFVVTSGTTANTVSCKIDGTGQTSSGTIPASSWFSIVGTNGTPGSYFTAIEERIQILGISR